jgi:hypothetical protein
MKSPHFAARSSARKGPQSTLYIFRSGKNPEISAFTLESAGSKLPDQLAPWTAAGTVLPDRSLPHGLPRAAAEARIKTDGFVLWRMKQSTV